MYCFDCLIDKFRWLFKREKTKVFKEDTPYFDL